MRCRPVRLILPVALPAMLLGMVSLALASTKTIRDAQGDSKHGAADIKSVKAVAGGRRVTWTITAYDNFSTNLAPCVGIGNTASKHPLGDHFEICGDGVIQDFEHGGTAGHAKVKRPDRATIVYRIRRKKLGHVNAFSWAVQVRTGKKCFPDICDQAPEGPGKHVVQKL
ncbi:MAG: hypothetical protein AABM29_01210 [Actinomycetota bacterium]